MNLDGGGGGGGWRGGAGVEGAGVGGVVMDKIPHWLQNAACGEMGILNTPPPEPSPNSILQKKRRHIPIPEILAVKYHQGKKRIAIQMRCVYFCMAFEEKREVVSLKRRKGPLRYTPPPPPICSPSLPPFPSPLLPLRPTPIHSSAHARVFSL